MCHRRVGVRDGFAIAPVTIVVQGLGPLILGFTVLFVAIVDASAPFGVVGGGLGDFALAYGVGRSRRPVAHLAVITIIVIVQLGRFARDRHSSGKRAAISGSVSPAITP